MGNPAKIALVGAGSVVFSMRLIADLCLSKGLYGSTISLMNWGKEKLDVVYNLAKRYANETGADFHFEKTKDRWEHFTRSNEQANAVVDEIHSLPFNEEMKRHYR